MRASVIHFVRLLTAFAKTQLGYSAHSQTASRMITPEADTDFRLKLKRLMQGANLDELFRWCLPKRFQWTDYTPVPLRGDGDTLVSDHILEAEVTCTRSI